MIDYLTLVVAVIALLVSLFVSRSVYRLLDPDGTGRDGYAHLMYARDIRRANHRLPDRPSDVATGGQYSYPFLMHWLLSFLSDEGAETADRYFSGVLDVLFALVVITLVPAGVLTGTQAILVLLLLLATPEFMSIMAHGTGVSGRKPGLLFMTASLLATYLYVTTGVLVTVVLSVLFGAAVFLTSKFGLQAYFFVSLGLAVAVTPVAMLLFAVSLVAAVVLSRGAYVGVLTGHLTHLANYATSFQFKNSVPKFRDLLSGPTRPSLRTALLSIHRSPIAGIAYNPFLILVFLFSFVSKGPVLFDGSFFSVWLLSGIGAFLVTSVPPFQFLGEGRRYLEYVFLPAGVLLAQDAVWTGHLREVTVGVIVLGIVTEVVFVFVYARFRTSPESKRQTAEVVEFLRSVPTGTIIIQPSHQSREFAYKTPHDVLTFVMNQGTVPEESAKLFPDRHTYVTDDLAYLREEYDPDFVVFDTTRVSDDDPGLLPPSMDPIFENGRFAVYRFTKIEFD